MHAMNESLAKYISTIIFTMLASYLSYTKLLVQSSEINIFQLTITIDNHAFSLAIISFDKYIDNSYKDKNNNKN